MLSSLLIQRRQNHNFHIKPRSKSVQTSFVGCHYCWSGWWHLVCTYANTQALSAFNIPPSWWLRIGRPTDSAIFNYPDTVCNTNGCSQAKRSTHAGWWGASTANPLYAAKALSSWPGSPVLNTPEAKRGQPPPPPGLNAHTIHTHPEIKCWLTLKVCRSSSCLVISSSCVVISSTCAALNSNPLVLQGCRPVHTFSKVRPDDFSQSICFST